MNPQTSRAGSLHAYLDAHEVELLPCSPRESAHPRVTIPTPPKWNALPEEHFPGAHSVLIAAEYAEDNWTPNAVLLHGRLSRRLPTAELLAVAGTESRLLPQWAEAGSSTDDFRGHRSVFVRGTYRVEDFLFEVATRYLVVDSGFDLYLTQLTVTARAHPQAVVTEGAAAIHAGLAVDCDDFGAGLLPGPRR